MVKRFTISVSKKRNLYLIIHGIQAEKSNYIKMWNIILLLTECRKLTERQSS